MSVARTPRSGERASGRSFGRPMPLANKKCHNNVVLHKKSDKHDNRAQYSFHVLSFLVSKCIS